MVLPVRLHFRDWPAGIDIQYMGFNHMNNGHNWVPTESSRAQWIRRQRCRGFTVSLQLYMSASQILGNSQEARLRFGEK